jgi:hypothetical protein
VKLARETNEIVSSPSGTGTSETFEADMEFSCMPQEEYNKLVKEAKSHGLAIDKYLESIREENKKGSQADHDADNDEEESELSNHQDEEEYDDDIFDFFGGSMAEAEEEPSPPLRPFMVLWNAISGWLTVEAVALLREYKHDIFSSQEPPLTLESNSSPTQQNNPEMSDICASRCAALVNMLKINLVKSLDELGYSTSDEYTRRIAETRLGEFVQKFDFHEPMVQFLSIQWKALTIILLNIVLPRHDLAYEGKTGIVVRDGVPHELTLPHTLKELGMTIEEYKYLVDTAIPSLDVGSG